MVRFTEGEKNQVKGVREGKVREILIELSRRLNYFLMRWRKVEFFKQVKKAVSLFI